MSEAVQYSYYGDHIRTHFGNARAKLPVKMRSGQHQLYCWGRRLNECGNLPLGGWARLEDISGGKWEKYFPRPVKIAISAFMERDYENQPRWFPIANGQCLQGLLARYDKEQRIYIVTVTPQREDASFSRWPRIVF